MQLKWRLFNAASAIAGRLGILNLIQRVSTRAESSVAVLTYHRIADSKLRADLDPTLASATPTGFAEQLDYLGKHFTFVSADDVLRASRGQSALPTNALLLSFDDAYDDFATSAWPELRQRNIPAVLFVPTAFASNPSQRFWWDDLHYWLQSNKDNLLDIPQIATEPVLGGARSTRKAIKVWLKSLKHAQLEAWVGEQVATLDAPPGQKAVLGWNELRELAAEGLALCPHSVHHPIMTGLADAAVVQEIEESYATLQEQIGTTLPVFAYPSGYTDERVTAACAETSMELAFTTRFGISRLQRDNHWRLDRINANGSASAQAIRLMILGANLFR